MLGDTDSPSGEVRRILEWGTSCSRPLLCGEEEEEERELEEERVADDGEEEAGGVEERWKRATGLRRHPHQTATVTYQSKSHLIDMF